MTAATILAEGTVPREAPTHTEADRSPGVSQELVTAAVLDAVSNPVVIRRLVTAVPPYRH